MSDVWDVLVIGAGPAGLAAARAAAEAGARTACVERLGPGGLVMNLSHIEGWPDDSVSGADLAASMLDEAMGAGVELLFGEVTELVAGPLWIVRTDGEEHRAKAVVVATGLSAGTLGVPDEASFEGRGLSHCAACDGPIFAGQPVVVTGDSRWTAAEARELAEIAGSVTLVTAAPVGDSSIVALPGRVAALEGTDGLERVIVDGADGARHAIPAMGLFAYADRRPVLGFAGSAVPTDDRGWATVDAGMAAGGQGLFAAGDVRTGAEETVAAAVADGRLAGASAARLACG